MLHVKRPNQRNYKKLPFSLGIFTNIIAELVVDNALCGGIFAKCFQNIIFKIVHWDAKNTARFPLNLV